MQVIDVGDLKKILENVPDHYLLTINIEDQLVNFVVVDDEMEQVDFSY